MSRFIFLGLGLPGVGLLAAILLAAQEVPAVTSLIFPLLIIMMLVLINGLFVAAEFAIIGVRDTQIEQMADEGNVIASKVLEVLEIRPSSAKSSPYG